MTETIEVRYKYTGIDSADPEHHIPYYHMYLVYTDSDGNELAARGGTSAASAEGITPISPLGTIVTTYGTYDPSFVDYHDPADGPQPSEVIATGSDLSTAWDSILTTMDEIGDAQFSYLAYRNSNSVVVTALENAGLPGPTLNGPGGYNTPGSGTTLPVDNTDDPTHPVDPTVSGPHGTMDDGKHQASPLVIDLSTGHTGITLTEFNASTTTTFFDIEGTGFATQTAWTSGDTGFLVRDLNSNGLIDGVNEMFGSPTIDGFAKLAVLDSNHDLKIDSNDTAWSSLQVWTDSNGNGLTESGELHSLSSLGIVSIDLASVAASTSVIDGNSISHTSTVTFSDNSTAAIDDAWFTHDGVNSFYTGTYTFDPDTLVLPDLRGYGLMPELAISVSSDSTLKGMVEDFASAFTLDSFADPATLNTDIANILYRWAGVDGVSTDSRGPNVNAQDLEFLEHLFDDAFVQASSGSPDPQQDAASNIETAWHSILDTFTADILVQTVANTIFDSAVTYNVWTGAIDGTVHLSEAGISDLATHAPGTEGGAEAFWVEIANFIDHTEGISNLDTDEQTWLDTAVTSTTTIGWSDIVNLYGGTIPGTYVTGTSGNDTLNGGDGDDTISGGAGNDIVHGGSGNDSITEGDGNNSVYGEAGNDTITVGNGNNVINGGDGNDVIWTGTGVNTIDGGAGNDEIHGGNGGNTISGGTGGNLLHGGSGSDTFIFGGGDDVIYGNGGTDQIVLPSGITSGDLTFSRVSSDGSTSQFNDLLITVASGGTIQIFDHFLGSGYQVPTLVFSDSSTLDLTSLTGYSTVLTGGDDDYSPGLNINQTVYGQDGNDIIVTGSGNDTLDGGNGNDLLEGGGGSDTYMASPGFDKIEENGAGGTDTIVVPTGYSLSDVTFSRHIGGSGPDNDLILDIRGLGEIQIVDQFYSSAYAIENLYFTDGASTISLTDQIIQSIGTTGDDTISGLTSGVGGNWFDGRGGNDTFIGGTGDNTFVYAAGFGNETAEVPYHTGNTNTVYFEGVDPANVRMWTDSSGNLHLQDTTDPTHSITVDAGTTGSGTDESAIGSYLEQVKFDDTGSTTWNLTSGLTITGTSSGETLYGTAHNDTLYSMGGNDTLYGNGGNDTYVIPSNFGNVAIHESLSGGTDTVHLSGIDPSNVVVWTDSSGNLLIQRAGDTSDTITLYGGLSGGNSTIGSYIESIAFDNGTTWDLTSGLVLTATNTTSTTLTGTSGNDIITIGTGGGTINAGDGNDILNGNSGTDVLNGGNGNDQLTGGAGGDTLNGGAGNDTYVFASGWGADTISESLSAGTDTIHFTNLNPSDVRMYTDTAGTLHVVNNSNGSDSITVAAGQTGSNTHESTIGQYVESMTFADGTTWNLTGGLILSDTSSGGTLYGTANGDTLVGGTGVDTFYGNAGNDTIISGGGADTMNGGPGNDTYVFASGFGSSTVAENLSSGTDTINFTGIDPAHILMYTDTSGNLHFEDSTNSSYNITVNGGLTGSNFHESKIGSYVESVTFDSSYSTTWDLTAGLHLTNVTSGGSLYGTAYDDTLNGGSFADTLYGNAGNDTLISNGGADSLQGGVGNDTYVFASGFGNATVAENLSQGTDTINFTGIDPAHILMYTDSFGALHFQDSTNPSYNITVNGGTTGSGFHESSIGSYVESVTFDSSYATTWDLTGGLNLTNVANGNSLYGTAHDDTLNAGSFNGSLYGNGGNDALNGKSGTDALDGGAGDDILYGGGGTDSLTGGTGADTFLFKAATALGASATIADFNTSQGDKIDITDVLDGHYDPVHDAISDFVSLTTSGANTLLKVDLDGTGGSYSPTQIALIQSVTGLSLATLISDHHLIVPT